MVGERVVTVGLEELDELAALLLGEAGADADVLERTGYVVKAEEQRTNGLVLGVFVPAEAGDNTVAVTLVLDLQHGSFVRLIGAGKRLGDYAVEACAFEAPEPVLRSSCVASSGGDVNRLCGVCE